jgi:hypothetical protein
MNITYSECTPGDYKTIGRQIGNREVNCGGIIQRCFYGCPRIILLNPVKCGGDGKSALNYESISNVMWLTCPYLNRKIHEIENRGYIEKIGFFLKEDRLLTEKMSNAHAHYFYIRKRIYRDFFNDLFPESEIKVFNTGIGGVRDPSSIKCLHVHFSHYQIFPENVAGRLTSLLLDDVINCEDGFCLNADEAV